MKTTFVVAAGMTALIGLPAFAADLPVKTPSPAPAAHGINWTGFYVFGGAGGGLWNAESNVVASGRPGFPDGTAFSHDQRLGGSGWFGTVGLGYDWQFNTNWVAGAFADAQLGKIRGSIADPLTFLGLTTEGRETMRTSWAAGARLGYLVAPNVLSYVNAGYSRSEWSGAEYSSLPTGIVPGNLFATPSFHRDGWFVGGGVENSLDLFGLATPGWFMKTEYRAAYYDRAILPGTISLAGMPGPTGSPTTTADTFKPWVQTISTSLVYRFNPDRPMAAAPTYTKAPSPVMATNWSGVYLFGGGGGGLWAADSSIVTVPGLAPLSRDQRLGGSGWFGTVGAGYDWQFGSKWVAGLFADGQFGNIHGSITDPAIFFSTFEGQEKLRTSYAAGARLGYLVAPNVLSYVNTGYSGSDWSGASYLNLSAGGGGGVVFFTTPSFHRDGWFVGGGVENSVNILGVAARGWFMKTEYRAAYYDRATAPETNAAFAFFGPAGTPTGNAVAFKPWTQTISTSLVYRFN